MEYKALALELKASGDGEVAGYAATFGGRDSYGDTIEPGAFAGTLASGRKVRLLWQHDLGEPIGVPVELREDHKGLWGRWRVVPTTTGAKAMELVRHGLIDALSIGFIAGDHEYNADGVRVLKSIDLHEVSLVTIPANEEAVITGYKRAGAHQGAIITLDEMERDLEATRRRLHDNGVRIDLELLRRDLDPHRRLMRSLGIEV